ncbi:MAG: GNAT family N-acetyltransferase [Frankiales bacterium]|nr:GNAT family N-acetyltransferase [Frankiales bacterium]
MTRHELRTPRLALRAWREDDLGPFAAMNADERVMRWFPSTMTREQSAASMARFDAVHAELGFTAWAVEVLGSTRGSAPFVGFVGLVPPSFEAPFPHAQPLVEVGWRLAPDWWGLGIATEAAAAALRFGLLDAGLPEVVSFTVPANLASQAVMQRLGMRYDGVFDHPRATPGQWWRPHVLYRAVAGDLGDDGPPPADPSGRTHP